MIYILHYLINILEFIIYKMHEYKQIDIFFLFRSYGFGGDIW